MSRVPTPEQHDAITHPLSPLLLAAGAGTGKTSVMADRILHLVTSGQARADQILGLTFTNKAAAELKQRVVERLGADADVTVSTYHAFAGRLVTDHLLELRLHPRTMLLNRAQAWQLLFSVFDEFRFERRSSLAPEHIITAALTLASRCADHLVDVLDLEHDCVEVMGKAKWRPVQEAAAKRLELCQVVAAYDRRKRERNLIDYGDQIRLAVQLLGDPDCGAALYEQHPVVLLDEYQDTNYAQRVLLQRIYPPGSAITAVGDDMQSIYAFRGAHLENLLRFGEHFPPCERRSLTINFRSGEAIVALANRVHERVDPGRTLGNDLRARPDAPPAEISCFLAADEREEAETIAADIAAAGAPWGANAVLCRKRRVIPAVVEALEARDIPVDVGGTSGLLARPEVVDLVAWIEVLANPGASVALLRLLRGPRYRIGVRDLAALARHARALGGGPDRDRDAPFQLADAMADLANVPDLSAEARDRLTAFLVERDAMADAAAHLPVLDLAELIVAGTDLWAAARPRGRENLLRFLDVVEQFAPVEGDPGLAALVDYLQLLDQSEEELSEAHLAAEDAVRVMTIHQAKGLEFAHVWVPGLARGVFPDSRGGENPMSNGGVLPWWVRPDGTDFPSWRTTTTKSAIDDFVRERALEEEWRLLYVACTRAERRLTLSAGHWYGDAGSPQGPSPFYAAVAEQDDLVTERFRHDPPDTSPAVATMQRRADRAAVRSATAHLPSDGRLFEDPAPAALAPAVRAAPLALSVSALVSYARCPRQCWWSVVRPLPRRASAAAQLGTQIHRWIEERAGRQLVLLEPEPEPVVDPGREGDGGAVGPSVAEGLRASFLASPYAELDPRKVEAPFVLAVGGRIVRGRIDAVYERDGYLELVDFKTGRRPAPGDAGATVQLDLYALAALDAWGAAAPALRTTYCYLRAEGPAELDSYDWDAARVAAVRARLDEHLKAIDAGMWSATAGAWCERCDFVEVCPAGQAAVRGPS
jgi:DNA helicase II / ATP-dependent DNA helicase PcrA